MQNEAQYDLDRKAAKISVLSSKNLEKYEYLTAEDLGLKPSTVEQTRFEYSLLGKIFNKWLRKDDQIYGLFKRIRNIESKNEAQLKSIKNINISSKPLTAIGVFSTSSDEAKKLMANIKKLMIGLTLHNLFAQRLMKKNNNFSNFTFPSKFASLPMMNTVNTEFSYIEVWFTNQNSNALEIEDNVNLTLIIGYYKNEILNITKI